MRDRANDLQLLPIWGDLNQVEAAKAQLQALIERYKTAHIEWVKVGNQSEIQKLVADRKIEEEAIKQSFRRDPPNDETFQYQVAFFFFGPFCFSERNVPFAE